MGKFDFKKPEPVVTKIVMGDYVGEIYPCAKFHPNPTTGFCPPPYMPMKMTGLLYIYYFLVGGSDKFTA